MKMFLLSKQCSLKEDEPSITLTIWWCMRYAHVLALGISLKLNWDIAYESALQGRSLTGMSEGGPSLHAHTKQPSA